MTLSHQELKDFAVHLTNDVAVPVLQNGYVTLVQSLRMNEPLGALARRISLDNLLGSDRPEIAALKKGNKEVVTSFEKEAEKLMADAVRARYPKHAIVGEEHDYQPGSETRWVFDPVDGTSAMIRSAMAQAFGIPLPEPRPAFGISIGVVHGDKAELGVITELSAASGTLQPVHTWVGGTGLSTTADGNPVIISPPASLAETHLTCTVPEVMFNSREKWSGYQALSDATQGTVTDQNCVGFMRLLQKGSAIGVGYESDLAYHDAAALVPILENAGITVSDAAGKAIRFPENAITREFHVLAAAPKLHKEAVALIAKGVEPGQNRYSRQAEAHKGYAQKFPPAGL